MQFEYQEIGRSHRLVIVTTKGEWVEGRLVHVPRTPTICYAGRKYAWLGGRVVSIDPIGRPCNGTNGKPCNITLVGNTYCTKCADILHERRKKAEAYKQDHKESRMAKGVAVHTSLGVLIAALSPEEKRAIIERLR